MEFMCTQNNFNEERIRSSIKKLIKAKGTATQVRLDSFFTITPNANSAAKRKVCLSLMLIEKQRERGALARIPVLSIAYHRFSYELCGVIGACGLPGRETRVSCPFCRDICADSAFPCIPASTHAPFILYCIRLLD